MRWGLVGICAAFVFGIAVGGGFVRHQWQSEKLKTAQETIKQMDELQRQKEDALNELAKQGVVLDALNTDNRDLLERLRIANKSGVSVNTSSACQRQLKECRGLVEQGAELVTECGSMVGKLSNERNAVRKMIE